MTRYTLRTSASDRRRAKVLETKNFFEENEFCAQITRRFFAVVPTISMEYSFDIDPESPPSSSGNNTVNALLQTISNYVSPSVYNRLKTCWNDYHMTGASKITLESVIDQVNDEARRALAYSYNG